jgi:putative oxidoreductase
MKKLLFFNNSDSYAPPILRVTLFIVLFPHGAQKLLGWFGGFGFTNTMNYFTETAGLPWIIGFLVIMIEFFGPLALLVGFTTRLWSIVIGIIMAGIIFTTHNEYFFMNWFGNQKAEGAEYFLLAIGIAAALAITGAGKYSVDKVINEKYII